MSEPVAPIRVLLADDEDAVAALTQALLAEEERIDLVGRARNGAEAITLAEELSPDLVLMDIVMPELDGIEATRHIRAQLPGIEVIMLSASTLPRDVERSQEAGAAAFVAKDRMGRELVATILALIDR